MTPNAKAVQELLNALGYPTAAPAQLSPPHVPVLDDDPLDKRVRRAILAKKLQEFKP